jgi:hypothetical protein
VLRRLLVIAATLAGSLAASASAQLSDHTLLAPGITYDRQVEFTSHGPVVLHVITAPKPDGTLYRIAPVLSNNAVVATDKLTSMEQGLAGEGTAAGVNGDYFDANPGDPKGMVIRNGVLDSPPASKRSSAGFTPDGALQVARVAFNGIWRGTGQRRATTINQSASAGPVTLYTSSWGPTTPPETNAVADVIPSLPPTKPNTDLITSVSQQLAGGNVPIPPGGAVLVARGNQVPFLQREAPPGTSLFLRMALTPDWSGMANGIGGGPVLVQNGKPVFRAGEDIAASLLNPRAARSAVGQLADGRILLVTVDGGGAGYSVGMTNFELAVALVRLGAVQAMALGSGPAAAMAFDGSLLSRPSAAEPQISDALVVLYTGVYAPLPSETVVSPNDDGVADTTTLAYRLARTSTVNAVVMGGGTRQVLDSGTRQPGLHSFTFTGKAADGTPVPEGSYKLSVNATDDRGVHSLVERVFSVNNTLSALSVSPSALRLRKNGTNALQIGFTLARAAKVTGTVETKSGIVIRKLDQRAFVPGPQHLVWDGRTSGGGLAFNGAYVVRIAAENAVGEVELTQPFTARRG